MINQAFSGLRDWCLSNTKLPQALEVWSPEGGHPFPASVMATPDLLSLEKKSREAISQGLTEHMVYMVSAL